MRHVLWLAITLWILRTSQQYGMAFLSIDSIFQRLTQVSVSKSIEQSGSEQGGKDIFLTTLQNFNAGDSTALVHSVSSLKTSLEETAKKSNYNCSIKNSDILTVLMSTQQFMGDLYNHSNISLSQGLSDITSQIWAVGDLKESCQAILYCNGNLQNNEEISDNPRQIGACQSAILNTYQYSKTLESNFSNLPLLNNNDNIYMDSVKENGLFDIMLDIEAIKELLFDPGTGWPELPKMIYYSLPTVSNWNNNNSNPTIPWTIGGGTNNGGSGTSSSWTNTPPTTGTSQNMTGSTGQGGIRNTTGTVTSEIDDFLTQTSTNNGNIPTNPLGNTATTTISQAICLVDGSERWTINTNLTWWTMLSWFNSWNSTSIIDEFTDLQDDLIDAMSGYLYTPWYNSNPTTNIGGNFIQTTGAVPSTTPVCSASCSNTEGTEKLICEWKCCMNNCNQISNLSDRAVCLSQCLCWEASTANDMLRIKICRVPAQPSRVVAWKKITSIEQAVDEINQIFLKLRQNGALTKRTKTQEFLDSSFSSIKFHKILAFDIFVAIKPIYDRLQLSEVEKKAKETEAIIAKLNGTDPESKWNDTNKYNLSRMRQTISENCESYGMIFNTVTWQCKPAIDNKTVLKDISQTHGVNLRNDSLGKFLGEQYTFREEAYNQIIEIQITSENLRAKAEQAK